MYGEKKKDPRSCKERTAQKTYLSIMKFGAKNLAKYAQN